MSVLFWVSFWRVGGWIRKGGRLGARRVERRGEGRRGEEVVEERVNGLRCV